MEGEPLDTLRGSVRRELVVLRSRFIATLAPAAARSEADALIADIRREMYDARHHCTAMIFGPRGERERSNDDGEPPGTAGAPMLAVLRGAGLTDVVAVVTRYFGGTLLGAGGLARAYAGATNAAVKAASRLPRRRVTVFDVASGHEDAGRLEHRLRNWAEAVGAEVTAGRYDAAGVTFEVAVPRPSAGDLENVLAASGLGHRVELRGQEIRTISS